MPQAEGFPIFRVIGDTLVTATVCAENPMLASLVGNEIQQAVQVLGNDEPYAFALIQGQQCKYLGYAIATTNALSNRVKSYITKGYRYHGSLRLPDAEGITSWLKWANPDDGWHFFEFRDQIAIHDFLQKFDGDDEALRTECIKELRKASMENTMSSITLGVTYGQDPTDFYHSVLAIYGKHGHKNFLTEFALMERLDACIKKE